jgi:hypothetical protein
VVKEQSESREVFGMPIDRALSLVNSINVGALWVVAVAGAIIAVSTFFIIKWQHEISAAKDKAFEKYKIGVAVEIADANARAEEAKLELEKFKQPRHFVQSANFEQVGKMYLAGRRFDLSAIADWEPMMLAQEVRKALVSIGMIEVLSKTKDHWTPPNGAMPIGAIVRPGVAVRACEEPTTAPTNKPTPARILGALLADSGLGTKDSPVFLEPWEKDDCSEPGLLHVEIGSKLPVRWQAPESMKVVYPSFQISVPKQ